MKELKKFPNRFVSTQFVSYIDHSEIKGIIGSLGHAISEKYKGEELVLVGVLKGSAHFLSELCREIKGVKVWIDFVKVGHLGRSKDSIGSIFLEKDIGQDIHGKHVLVVEDIIDSGRALFFIKQRLFLAGPQSLETVTLFDKPSKRAVPVVAEHIGKSIEDQFIVGFGMDVEGYGRNLKDVFFLKYPQ